MKNDTSEKSKSPDNEKDKEETQSSGPLAGAFLAVLDLVEGAARLATSALIDMWQEATQEDKVQGFKKARTRNRRRRKGQQNNQQQGNKGGRPNTP